MNIGIVANEYFIKSAEGYLNRLIINNLIEANHDKNFLFFADEKYQQKLPAYKNAAFAGIKLGSLLQKKWFETVSFPKAIKQNKTDILIYLHPLKVAKTQASQFLILHNASLLQKLNDKICKNLSGIIVTSSYLKNELIKTKILPGSKIFLTEGIKRAEYNEITFDDKLDVRENYARGKQYFVCSDYDMQSERFIFLLKAFSLFKQRLQSNWRLLVIMRSKKELANIETLLSTYKYRDDVNVIAAIDSESLSQITASSYSLISVITEEIFPVNIFEAFQYNTPAIAIETQTNTMYNDAVLMAKNTDPAALAEKMMQLYKDETLREKYVAKGKKILLQCDFEEKMNELKEWLLRAK